MVSGAEWFEPLDQTSVLFHHLGKVGIEKGLNKMMKCIDLTKLEEQIVSAKKETKEFMALFKEIDPSGDESGDGNFLNEILKLESDLGTVYSLIGDHGRRRRSINFVGSGLKYLFGTMDKNDEILIKKVLQSLGDRQDKLHNSMVATVQVMTNLSTQWETMRQNQQIQLENFRVLKDVVANHYSEAQTFYNKMNMRTFELHFQNLVLSIKEQINSLKNAILFLQTGVIDPYFISSEELLPILKGMKLGFNISIGDVRLLMKRAAPVAISHFETHRIFIILSFPTIEPKTFNLYEILSVPKLFKSEIYIVDQNTKYFANSLDNLHYFTMKSTEHCSFLNRITICNQVIVINSAFPDCLTDMFYRENDALCEYRNITHQFHVHNVLNSGVVFFSTNNVKLNLSCGKNVLTKNITGGVLLTPPKNCSIHSKYFDFNPGSLISNRKLKNKIPKILCCSKFFKIDNVTKNNSALVYGSLHDLYSLNTSVAENSLKGWTKFHGINLEEHFVNWRMYFIALIVILVILLIVWCKLRRGSGQQTNLVVQFSRPPAGNDNDTGYPVFK